MKRRRFSPSASVKKFALISLWIVIVSGLFIWAWPLFKSLQPESLESALERAVKPVDTEIEDLHLQDAILEVYVQRPIKTEFFIEF